MGLRGRGPRAGLRVGQLGWWHHRAPPHHALWLARGSRHHTITANTGSHAITTNTKSHAITANTESLGEHGEQDTAKAARTRWSTTAAVGAWETQPWTPTRFEQGGHESEKDRIAEEDGGGEERMFVLAMVDHVARQITVTVVVGEGGGALAGKEEEEHRWGRRRSTNGGAPAPTRDHW